MTRLIKKRGKNDKKKKSGKAHSGKAHGAKKKSSRENDGGPSKKKGNRNRDGVKTTVGLGSGAELGGGIKDKGWR